MQCRGSVGKSSVIETLGGATLTRRVRGVNLRSVSCGPGEPGPDMAARARKPGQDRFGGLRRREPQLAEYSDRRLEMRECVGDDDLGATVPCGFDQRAARLGR